MNEDVSPKDHRFKIIVVTTIMAALIISIGVWAITSAVNSTKEKNAATNNTETSITKTETETKEDSTSQTTSSNVASPPSEYTVSAPTVTTSNDLPTSGPTDIIVSTLALGTIVALILVNIDLVQRRQA
ncbi:MAG: hypothetical protein Q4E70_01650 [Candidatus Saccharibacteria bacterium]|nr:hypothetical protein [Candidatus Saccharibacteria bacterium]